MRYSRSNALPRAQVSLMPISALAVMSMVFVSTAQAQLEFDQEPINYGRGEFNDPIAQLQKKLDRGEATLEFHEERGYLDALMEALEVPVSSQVLVNSKTSFQMRRISPRRPRALYFNDTTHVGWVQNGDVLEMMATDPVQGEVFYTLKQEQVDQPKFIRDRGNCIVCHASSRTQQVPGGLVRSVMVDAGGQPQYGSGTFNTDHSSPFEERWGGWYVTGTHGDMRHMGNVTVKPRQAPETLDRESGANVIDLNERFDTSPYLSGHSDIVALMVLEHQTQMQNFITRANFECRSAEHYDGVMNKALERSKYYVSDTTKRRIASTGEKLVRYMLFADEFALTSPVKGTSGFAEEFAALGPRDSKGRSLRDFNLQTRLFKYPCSYMIYTPAFDALPPASKKYVTDRLLEVLTNKKGDEEFAHLSADDRKAILEILKETKPSLWKD